MNKNQLDNISGQELKEMIDKEAIALEELDNSALEKLMSYETEMLCLGNGDMTIISRCSMLLNERNSSDSLDKEKFLSVIEKTKNERVNIIDNDSASKEATLKVIKKRKPIFRKGALIAAVLSVMIIASALVSSAFGFNFFKYLAEIVREPVGTQITVDGFTFYHNGESKQYSSIEEMIEKENLDIMYPTKWPEGIYVVTTQLITEINGNTVVQFFTNNVAINFEVELNSSPKKSNSDQSYEHNGVLYHIVKHDIYTAACNYKGENYYISADTKENLIFIIENMKE